MVHKIYDPDVEMYSILDLSLCEKCIYSILISNFGVKRPSNSGLESNVFFLFE